jgi:hypothetical protein
MTSSTKLRRCEAVKLTRKQVEQITYDMGWESEDADAFWELARRETKDPGCLERENRAYWQRVLARDGEKR